MKRISIFFTMLILVAIFNGWVFSVLWNWFVVPIYNYPITLFHGVGLDLFVTIICPHEYKEKSDEELIQETFNNVVVALMLLALGYLAHILM